MAYIKGISRFCRKSIFLVVLISQKFHQIVYFTIYEPVCGCDGFNYTNSSAADCNGVLNYYEGPCK